MTPQKRKVQKNRPPVRIPLPFDSTVAGLLGMKPAAVKKVKNSVAVKRQKLDTKKPAARRKKK